MKTHNGQFRLSAVALAVTACMIGMPVHADDEDASALKTPVNSVEVGAINVPVASAKFGEYNGMNKANVDANLNLSVRGGTAYDKAGEEGGTKRWSLTARDLGLSSRSVGATFSNQGSWNLGLSYDELTHNLSDSYTTPSIGDMGGNTFKLPPSFTGGSPASAAALSAAQMQSFNEMDVSTTRKTTSLNAGMQLTSHWALNLDFNHLEQTGAKLMAVPEMSTAGTVNNGIAGENPQILPVPTNYMTDTINLGVNWTGEKAYFNVGYAGSFFYDANAALVFQPFMTSPAAGALTLSQQYTTPPNNMFHQFNAGGGYTISPETKLAGNLSYGLNTQDAPFVIDPNMMVPGMLPEPSMGGVVRTTHADLKVTNQTTQQLVLGGGFRYDRRENYSPAGIFAFNAVDGSIHVPAGNPGAPGAAASPWIGYSNTPLSTSKALYEFTGDYKIKRDQHLNFSLGHEDVARWCDNYGVNNLFVAGTNCVVAKNSAEDKVEAVYRIKPNDDLGMKLGYSYANRITNSDMTARAAFVGTNGGLAVPTAVAATYTMQGLNAGDYQGFHPFFDASRAEQVLKASTNWQATEKVSLTASAKVVDDAYPSAYGVTHGSGWSLDLDSTYNWAEDGTISAYFNQQHRERSLTDIARNANTASAANVNGSSLNIPAFATWTNNLTDDDVTVGITAKKGGLMDGKLTMQYDLTYTVANTLYGTSFNYNAATTGGLTCSSAYFLTCGSLPSIMSESIQFKVTGKYDIDKKSKLLAGYTFQQLHVTDYYYNAMQFGLNPTNVMPTNQQAPAYTVNVISLGYVYNF